MRVNSSSFTGISNCLHFHDGATCHGPNDLQIALRGYKNLYENIDVYEHTDRYEDKSVVKCYVGIRPDYDMGHYKKYWKKRVKLVATIRVGLTVTLI